MRILALLPDIHRLHTGGNLFNRHVLSFLESVAGVERLVVTENGAITKSPSDATLIDSLLLPRATDARRHARGPVVLIAHYLRLFEPDLRSSPEARHEHRLIGKLDGVVTTSEFCRDTLLEEGFGARRLAAITPGLERTYTLNPPPRPKASSQEPSILTVSTLIPGKGLRQLLHVLEGLEDLDWTWEIAGDAALDRDFSTAFHRSVERSTVGHRVQLLGAIEPNRMIDLYDRCHILVLPSRFETCSMATMEAMARGLPVVAWRTGGLPERVPEATGHLLADLGDLAGFGQNLRRLLGDLDAAAGLGLENRKASRDFPSWEDAGAAMWSFLQDRVSHGEP